MIFGATAVPASSSPIVNAQRAMAYAVTQSPTATAAQKEEAFKLLQTLTPAPPPTPGAATASVLPTDFLTANKTTLLVGGGVALAAGVGYWAWKRRKGGRR